MFKDIFQDILYTIVTGSLVAIIRYIIIFIRAKLDTLQLEQKVKYLPMIEDIVEASVNTVAQKYVDDLKAAGSFDSDAAKQANKAAKDLIYNTMSDDMKQIILLMSNDIDEYISMKIESQVRNSKGGR